MDIQYIANTDNLMDYASGFSFLEQRRVRYQEEPIQVSATQCDLVKLESVCGPPDVVSAPAATSHLNGEQRRPP
jgi:hypothetical protein